MDPAIAADVASSTVSPIPLAGSIDSLCMAYITCLRDGAIYGNILGLDSIGIKVMLAPAKLCGDSYGMAPRLSLDLNRGGVWSIFL